MTLPVVHVNLLNQLVHTGEGGRFYDLRNFILDLIWKFFVQLVSESRITPGDSGCEVIEINKIFYYPLIVLHLESFELILHVSFGVVQSEVAFELGGELGIVRDPIWRIVTHESRFEPV